MARMNARRLIEEVLILAPIVTKHETYGTTQEEWAAAFTYEDGSPIFIPAEVVSARGSRMISLGDIELIDDIVVNVRLNEDITDRMRLRWQGRLYQLIAPPVHSREDDCTRISARRLPE